MSVELPDLVSQLQKAPCLQSPLLGMQSVDAAATEPTPGATRARLQGECMVPLRHEHPEATTKRILLIEDDDAIRLCPSKILKHGGFEVLTATDGRQGMILFQKHAFDLVITDLFMPAQDGAETIMAIRGLCTGFKIIAISGGGKIVRPEYLEPVVASLGVSCFLMKPFTGERLLAEVNAILDDVTPPHWQRGDVASK